MQGEVRLLTFNASVFAKMGNLMEGESCILFSIKAGLCDGILLTSFMDLYAKCGELRNSGQLLGEISSRSCITWKATSQSGFIQDGSYVEAIELFRQMLDSGLKPGAEILGSPLDACMLLGALQIG